MPISEVYNEDNMVGMARYPDKYFPLAIIDPPYGIGEDGRKNHTRGCKAKSKDYSGYSEYDNKSPSEQFFKELMRVSKNQVIFGANHFISKIPFDSSCWLVWDKDNGETDFADCELAWTSFNTAVRKFRFKWQGMLQENMKNKEVLIHPNHKPIQLYKWILKNYAKEGDKILDTHLGSGSSRIACYEGGFDFVGFELDKDYYEAQEKRFEIHKSQQTFNFEK
jgi:site-specific DNA-methyltransferase (adenine-specific)